MYILFLRFQKKKMNNADEDIWGLNYESGLKR